MTGDCHVRFCERLGGEIPPCLLGVLARGKNNGSHAESQGTLREKIKIDFALYERISNLLKGIF